jgi:hypothetical protein
MTDSSIVLLPRQAMIQTLHTDTVFSQLFTRYLLARNIRIEDDLVDQLFNSMVRGCLGVRDVGIIAIPVARESTLRELDTSELVY